ncbi:beta-ketoacyl-[acyl-carrier-protein] synthase family protein [Stratiformator vulcanicus]|uniref:3-oxoacyl-[acyl-carrier-protein] synthase 2 n=1 Tax=Stratiformator vulcanicus TaxID=2527980 RepID=A0A517R1T6_9PLAN|nr:beta-ketoacyl-[acyl-carrier-protein] synthase family protein [Stratiformator vulcanicus]QDT37846.1 3-oxoacyl-[acyl-carrier-protein] synthase 2 [Stratiformator vulcanicus]
MPGSAEDIVITGIGCATPLGPDWESSWRRLAAGEVATRRLDAWAIDDDALPPAADFAGAPLFPDSRFRPSSESTDTAFADPVYGLSEAILTEALERSGLSEGELTDPQTSLIFGNSKGSVWGQSIESRGMAAGNSDFFSLFPAGPSTYLAGKFGIRGPVLAPVAACATGLVCLIRSADMLRHGTADRVICGAADASLHPAILASAHRLGVSSHEDDPRRACRPFERRRSGFLVGEGGAAFVLERRRAAEKRGAEILAVWRGGLCGTDPTALTALDESGRTLGDLMIRTLQSSETAPGDIDYINYHGTATIANDLTESRAVRRAFPRHAEQTKGSSAKGQIGHLLGAAGAVETAMTIAAIRHDTIPPTANLDEVDPECGLDYTPLRPALHPIKHALKLSLGFGGTIATALLSAPDG